MLVQSLCGVNNTRLNYNAFRLFIRHGHRLRGKAPGVARTLEQRLAEERAVDPELARKVNIGFPHLKPARSAVLKERLTHLKAQRANTELEKASRTQTLTIDPNQVKSDWLKTSGPFHVRRVAEHYGIFEHLFGAAYFVPRVNLDITFFNGDTASPVYYGNVLKPSEASQQPEVAFDSSFDFRATSGSPVKTSSSLWTLVLTNPDGHFTDSSAEYCHWFVANIPNGDLQKGDKVIPYLQPIPPKGTGFHRHVFILYKQEKRLDMSEFKVEEQNMDLAARTFKTCDFYRKYQDDITPAGLAFFQSDWDKSLIEFYQNVLKMKHPVFEYDFPKPFLRDQEWFPLRKPFNLYMDKYRDPKQVAKEYLARKLARTHPFEGPETPLRFPGAHPVRNVPSWLRTEIKRDRLGWGRINDV
ncbi:39S ribosomal protein L38, mitochondrial [Wyeomyia smithii]|uniref:39S ribosomal protein L38, mitochondrial n=1 Tax=Wyeomyia smithii TaxID=174621 RepID=UPI002467B2EE|nr:39S ribosomal protein L38, mitochondrial [Wyeomyia smithii]